MYATMHWQACLVGGNSWLLRLDLHGINARAGEAKTETETRMRTMVYVIAKSICNPLGCIRLLSRVCVAAQVRYTMAYYHPAVVLLCLFPLYTCQDALLIMMCALPCLVQACLCACPNDSSACSHLWVG